MMIIHEKVFARVKCLRSLVEAIVEDEAGCERVLHLLGSVRGATA